MPIPVQTTPATSEELAWLNERVTLLQTLIRDICDARVEELAKAA